MESLPQGINEKQFTDLSARVRAAAGHLSVDIQVHGSRVKGTARPDSDLDLAIRDSGPYLPLLT